MRKLFIIIMITTMFSSNSFGTNTPENDTFTIVFKGRVKVNAPASERENIQNFFGKVLGKEVEIQKNYDRVHFDGGGFVAYVYFDSSDHLLKKEDYLNSMQVGLLTPSSQYEIIKEKIKKHGISDMSPENPRYQNQEKFYYFHAPGNQVFRLVNIPDDKLENKDNNTSENSSTEIHKSYLVKYLELSKKGLENALSGLSKKQWHFKPADDVWSIAQIAEHLSKAESSLTGRAMSTLDMPLAPEKNKNINDRILFVEDFISEKNRQTVKIPVAPGTEPADTKKVPWSNPKEFLSYFKAKRQKTIDFVKTTDKDLMNHFMPTIPKLGDMNSYLWLVFMSAHNSRHTAQMLEVMNHPDFPSR
ncbi:DinB family protein [Psychroserpens algicola]|uniref:DinB family protein n=1 Tax=Psychroserpens algicola TaxID=1719034 RepID=A0ABT0H604_9FLAO|nr:DinB family protein [Psychroserpens algicola]MCK8479806.1 DinB family protein [Psychroserpens algicola]